MGGAFGEKERGRGDWRNRGREGNREGKDKKKKGNKKKREQAHVG